MPAHYEEVLCDLRARDARDTGREAAPLAQAADAILLDTSDLDVDAAIEAAIRLVEDQLARESRPA
jgi:cytidylate kinase